MILQIHIIAFDVQGGQNWSLLTGKIYFLTRQSKIALHLGSIFKKHVK